MSAGPLMLQSTNFGCLNKSIELEGSQFAFFKQFCVFFGFLEYCEDWTRINAKFVSNVQL